MYSAWISGCLPISFSVCVCALCVGCVLQGGVNSPVWCVRLSLLEPGSGRGGSPWRLLPSVEVGGARSVVPGYARGITMEICSLVGPVSFARSVCLHLLSSSRLTGLQQQTLYRQSPGVCGAGFSLDTTRHG